MSGRRQERFADELLEALAIVIAILILLFLVLRNPCGEGLAMASSQRCAGAGSTRDTGNAGPARVPRVQVEE